LRRFWQAAAAHPAGDGWGVLLDGKPVLTPARKALVAPGEALARAIAAEWDAVEGEVKPAAMRLTSLPNAAGDRMGPNQADALAAYAASDLLCYRAGGPRDLVERQAAAWDPWLRWAEARYDVACTVTRGVMHVAQPPATVERLGAAVRVLDPFRLAGLHPVVTVGGSLILGLALLEGELDAEAVWATAHLDELWQAEMWGEDELAATSRADRRAALAAGARLLELGRAA